MTNHLTVAVAPPNVSHLVTCVTFYHDSGMLRTSVLRPAGSSSDRCLSQTKLAIPSALVVGFGLGLNQLIQEARC
eukprot:scaffold17724_cov51-Phaeocystis_antarctica.AAC.2